MSHQDAVVKIPKNFINIASSKDSKFTIIQHQDKDIWYSISSKSNTYSKWQTINQKFCYKNM